MLVDLGRNDLGRVCRPGTVNVVEFMQVEQYSHVHHIVSTVVGRLQDGDTAYDLLAATFPRGRCPGRPPRAMEIIDELEKPAGDCMPAASGTSILPGIWTRPSRSAPPCCAMERPMCKPAPASWPTPIRRPRTRSARTKPPPCCAP